MGAVWVFRDAFSRAARGDLEGPAAPILKEVLEKARPLRIQARPRDVIEAAIRLTREFGIPFVLEEGIVVDPVIANVDLWPTILDLVGLPPMEGVDGVSQLPLILEATSLVASTEPSVDHAAGAPLTAEALAPVVDVAIARWKEQLGEASAAILDTVTFRIADLQGLADRRLELSLRLHGPYVPFLYSGKSSVTLFDLVKIAGLKTHRAGCLATDEYR